MALHDEDNNLTPMTARWPKWVGYPIAAILEVVLTVFLLAIYPFLPLGEHAIVYVVAMMGVAYWLGEGPATLAFVMGLLAFEYFFIPPTHQLWPPGSTPRTWGMYAGFFIGTALVGCAMVVIRRSQRRAQRLAGELRRLDLQYMLLHETMLQGVVYQDADGTVISTNPAAERILGVAPAEFGGPDTMASQVVRLDGLPLTADEHPAMVALRTGEAQREAILGVRNLQTDQLAWVSVDAVPQIREGLPNRVYTILTDITERKQAEELASRHLALLQEALVPPKPLIESGYSACAVYLPASPGLQIGGDFYDVFRTKTGQVGVLIGDVSGKGVEAAALAAAARGTVHAFAYELSAAGTALSHANAVLNAQESASGRFVTMILVVIDPLTGAFHYARAGHPPAAIWRVGGLVEFLADGSIPVGLFPDQQYAAMAEQLNPGDKLILYTDGIIEARHAADLFELKGIERALVTHGPKAPDQMAAGLLADASEWAEGQLRDDIAILVIEREPSA